MDRGGRQTKEGVSVVPKCPKLVLKEQMFILTHCWSLDSELEGVTGLRFLEPLGGSFLPPQLDGGWTGVPGLWQNQSCLCLRLQVLFT